jgi:hypothetical protein
LDLLLVTIALFQDERMKAHCTIRLRRLGILVFNPRIKPTGVGVTPAVLRLLPDE